MESKRKWLENRAEELGDAIQAEISYGAYTEEIPRLLEELREITEKLVDLPNDEQEDMWPEYKYDYGASPWVDGSTSMPLGQKLPMRDFFSQPRGGITDVAKDGLMKGTVSIKGPYLAGLYCNTNEKALKAGKFLQPVHIPGYKLLAGVHAGGEARWSGMDFSMVADDVKGLCLWENYPGAAPLAWFPFNVTLNEKTADLTVMLPKQGELLRIE